MIGRTPRKITERILIEGVLHLESPTCLGAGDDIGLTDMMLLRDPLENGPLLTGASLAGAMRNYLREYERGYQAQSSKLSDALFGRIKSRESEQSWLIVDDALGNGPGIEYRDGVSLDPRTRTASDGKKFDIELLQAGTTFQLSFELLLTKDNGDMVPALAVALHGLETGEIGLGHRKRRGYGRCRVDGWNVRRFDLMSPKGLVAWLSNDRTKEVTVSQPGQTIMNLLDVEPVGHDRRRYFTIDADFTLASSLLIRSGSGGAGSPDTVHLTSQRNGKARPVLSGTSLAGALRARALRIAKTLWPKAPKLAADFLDGMFGKSISSSADKPTGSRVVTHESEITGVSEFVQNRVKIDRFTGGAYPTALFSQQPAFGGDASTVHLDVTLRQPADAEIGLLLLVVKDLWTGDLPVGGESSVGRGRLQGRQATFTLHQNGQQNVWKLTEADGRLSFEPSECAAQLEGYVAKLHEYQKSHDSGSVE